MVVSSRLCTHSEKTGRGAQHKKQRAPPRLTYVCRLTNVYPTLQGTDVREHVREVDTRLRQVELESIEDYIAESDNLVALHQHIQTCDGILQTMESLLGGFQADLGSISTEVRCMLYHPFVPHSFSSQSFWPNPGLLVLTQRS